MIEVEIDEEEVANIETTYGTHLTTKEFIEKLEIKKRDIEIAEQLNYLTNMKSIIL